MTGGCSGRGSFYVLMLVYLMGYVILGFRVTSRRQIQKRSMSVYRKPLYESNHLLDLFSDEYSMTIKGFTIDSIEAEDAEAEPIQGQIRLQDCGAGWGSGEHPTTYLCLKFLSDSVKKGDQVLDYGCGSGILSIFSIKALGAKHSVAVDIDELTLIAAQTNTKINRISDHVDVTHTRYVHFGEDRFPPADVTVANILPGPLTRLVAPIIGLTKPGGLVCLSGMRPEELDSVRSFYEPYLDEGSEKTTMMESEVFGEWVAFSFRVKLQSEEERSATIARLSSLAME
jgi:ribosomal protein L11 methylase PrmA